MNKTLSLILVLSAMLTTACSKNVNGVNPPPGVGGGSPVADYPPVGAREVSETFEGVLGCSGSLCEGYATFNLGSDVVVNENNLVSVTLPQEISNSCAFVEGETCSSNLFDGSPKSSITLNGANSKTCVYNLHGSPLRYVAAKIGCTIEVSSTNSKIHTNAPAETALRITLNYLVWE